MNHEFIHFSLSLYHVNYDMVGQKEAIDAEWKYEWRFIQSTEGKVVCQEGYIQMTYCI